MISDIEVITRIECARKSYDAKWLVKMKTEIEIALTDLKNKGVNYD